MIAGIERSSEMTGTACGTGARIRDLFWVWTTMPRRVHRKEHREVDRSRQGSSIMKKNEQPGSEEWALLQGYLAHKKSHPPRTLQ